ncbi:MAG: nucleotide exchange factor GrpE [Methanomassiliicoccus sp.]|nr:nucleotide exchange factor GrpE [Methanomassiliicoccus sp.]
MDKADGSEQEDNGGACSEEQLAALQEQLRVERAEKDRQASLAADYLVTAKRVQADFENYKRRTLREREDLVRTANHQLLGELLLVFDDFERALAARCSEEELRTGITKIHDNMSALLRDHGLREIPSDGRFDPSVHEAFAVGEGEDGKILEVFQKGYYLGDKVLRCSKVKVAKSSTGEDNG